VRWLLVLALGCQSATTDLATELERHELVPLDRATWDRIVVPEFRDLYEDYRTAFASATWRGPIATRKHFAGDAALTPNQARARWLLPVLFPSEIATAGGQPIDAVFVPDGGKWFALVGIDRVIRARVDRRDPACGAVIDTPSPSKTCRDAAFAVAAATLRTDDTRFVRTCAIARTACVKPSP
jgi:hypothetical protein